jgi:hypothetical protein
MHLSAALIWSWLRSVGRPLKVTIYGMNQVCKEYSFQSYVVPFMPNLISACYLPRWPFLTTLNLRAPAQTKLSTPICRVPSICSNFKAVPV